MKNKKRLLTVLLLGLFLSGCCATTNSLCKRTMDWMGLQEKPKVEEIKPLDVVPPPIAPPTVEPSKVEPIIPPQVKQEVPKTIERLKKELKRTKKKIVDPMLENLQKKPTEEKKPVEEKK